MKASSKILIWPVFAAAFLSASARTARADSLLTEFFGSSPPRSCDTHGDPGPDRPANQILAAAEKAVADHDYCKAANFYLVLDLQHPDVSKKVGAPILAMQALSDGGYTDAFQGEFDFRRIYHPQEPKSEKTNKLTRRPGEGRDNEYLERLLVNLYLRNLPDEDDRCTNPLSSTGKPILDTASEEVTLALKLYGDGPDGKWFRTARDRINAMKAKYEACVADYYFRMGELHGDFSSWRASLIRWNAITANCAYERELPQALYKLMASADAMARLGAASPEDDQDSRNISAKARNPDPSGGRFSQ